MKKAKLTKVEEAIIYLAEMLENPLHNEYKVKRAVLDILGYTTMYYAAQDRLPELFKQE